MQSATSTLAPVSFTRVKITDHFWQPRIRVNREQTLETEFRMCKETGRIDGFRLAPGTRAHHFWDSDVHKWLEAASYSLATHPDPKLEKMVSEVSELIAKAQQDDGYLHSYFSAVAPEKRWTNLRDNHELYTQGHFIEAAVAHYHATGKRQLLDVACRCADHMAVVFGSGPGQKRGYDGHEEVELALVKLYRTTGERKYLKLSEFFVNERGRTPHFFDEESKARGEDPKKYWAKSYTYCQAHKPVREQTEVTGHAVRALYLYSGLADLAKELNDQSLLETCRRLWSHATQRLMYVTGGLGSSRHNEGFTFDYDLPNDSAYCETCAQIAFVFWNHRLLQMECDGKYADVMERALYNSVLSGVSLDGKRFFYANPLEVYPKAMTANADHFSSTRQEWFGCACCPPNIARLLASFGEYVYSQSNDTAVVHLYVEGSGEFSVGADRVLLSQKTDYPWDGKVTLSLTTEREALFTLKLRIPGWCRQAKLAVNGKPFGVKPEHGYVAIKRTWNSGDQVELNFAMPAERIYAHSKVRMNCGRVALQRGPLVYCIEELDNGAELNAIALPRDAEIKPTFDEEFPGGVLALTGPALRHSEKECNGALYCAERPATEKIKLKAVPYYAWNNRGPGEMLVWVREA